MDITAILGLAESVSGFVIMAVILVWAVQQVTKGLREGKLSSVELAENSLRLLAEKQAQLEEQNRKIDQLYSENRTLRDQIHELDVTISSLQRQIRNLEKRTSD